ncbi:MAG: hydrogenase maturation protease [Candidatus Margulisbacteria bacterium]|nr:hydrogenase maturation protease [Candidatus Margulisiibacteriota bacterium]
MKLVVVGLGNPVMSDDSVGIKTVRELAKKLPANSEVIIKEAYAGGLRLMDELIGYEQAIIVDSIVTDKYKPGTIIKSDLQTSFISRNLSCSHDLDLISALELARISGLKCPEKISVWAIEAKDIWTFSEMLTAQVSQAVPLVVQEIEQVIDGLVGNLTNMEPVPGTNRRQG